MGLSRASHSSQRLSHLIFKVICILSLTVMLVLLFEETSYARGCSAHSTPLTQACALLSPEC